MPGLHRNTSDVLDSIKTCKLLYNSPAQNESAVILLRSRLQSVSQRMGYSESARNNMMLVASELVTNQLKYAKGSGMVQIWQQPGPCLDILALDYGPGIANLPLALEDGFSTSHTLGKGMGSIQRLSDETAIYTQAQNPNLPKWSGTAVMARFHRHPKKKPLPLNIGLFSRSLSDARYNGDRVYLLQAGDHFRWLHLDGLGHGEIAQETTSGLAAHLAHSDCPATAIAAVDQHLHGSRGAVAIAGEINLARRSIEFLGVGDMHAHVFAKEEMNNVSFAPGVLGREHKAPSLFRASFEHTGVVVTASDGIRRNWENSNFPGLFHQHPQLIAYVLGNIMGRISDDQSLCVVGINKQ